MSPRIRVQHGVDSEDFRHQRWTQAAADKARAARSERLKALRSRRPAISKGCERFDDEKQHGVRTTDVTLRPGLLYLNVMPLEEAEDPRLAPRHQAENPGLLADTIKERVRHRAPLGQLAFRGRGAAAPLLVAALGLAAFISTPGDEVDLSDIRNVGTRSWAKLIGDSNNPQIARRHVVDGLKRLRTMNLVAPTSPNSTNPGFTRWGLLTEDGTGDSYTIPQAGLTVPIDFWLNGWSQVLTTSEILAYLMIRHLAMSFPGNHATIGVGAAPAIRRQRYGITKTIYATLNELEEFGLLTRTTPRQPGQARDDSPRVVDRFRLTDDGLTKLAYETATSVLYWKQTPARLARYDRLDALVVVPPFAAGARAPPKA